MKKKKIYIYTFLFFFIMLIDQRIFTSSNLVRSVFRQATALPFLLMMIIQMNRNKLRNIYYKTYGLVAAIIVFLGSIYLWKTQEFYLQYIVLLIEIVLTGFILIYMFLNRGEYFSKKYKPTPILIFWVLILLLMGISKYEKKWPWEFLVIFVLLSFMRIKREEQILIFKGMTYGIILSYFIIQGFAFVFRPYDTFRYQGSFNNENMNALFYLVVFAAFLINQFMLFEENKERKYKFLNLFFLMSAFVFTILTMGKAAVLMEIILAIIYLVFMVYKIRNKAVFLLSRIGLVIVLTVVLLPVCFLTARFAPTLAQRPVWFYGEYSESKIHSYDSYDSEKYPSISFIVDRLLIRFFDLDIIEDEKIMEINDAEKDIIEENKETAVEGDGSDSLHPLYLLENASNSYSQRVGIWREYIKRIEWTGHRTDEPHFWLLENYYIFHAHNVFLEYSYNFGLLSGILFLIACLYCGFKQLINTIRNNRWDEFAILTYIILFGGFGMVELNWYVGQAPLVLFFFMICNMIWNESRELRGEYVNETKNS